MRNSAARDSFTIQFLYPTMVVHYSESSPIRVCIFCRIRVNFPRKLSESLNPGDYRMQAIMDFLIFFGAVFIVVLLVMLAFMKSAGKRLEADCKERQAGEKYLEGAPPEGTQAEPSGADQFDKG